MSDAKKISFIYETQLNKISIEKITEKKDDGTEITKPTKILKPIKLAILKPTRKLHESGEIYHAKTMAFLIKEGLLPYSLVAKRYANDGGPLSEPDKKYLEELKNKAVELQSQIFDLYDKKDEESEKKKTELFIKLNDVQEEFKKIEGAYADIFNNTAEIKARNRLVDWWVMQLSYIDEDGKGYKNMFGDGDLDAKYEKWDDFFDKNDEFYMDSIKRLSTLIVYWHSWYSTNPERIKSEDFQKMEKRYEENFSTYHPEELIKEEVKTV